MDFLIALYVSPAGQETSLHSGCAPKAARDGANPNEKVFGKTLLESYLLMPCCQRKSHSHGQCQHGRGLIKGEDTGRYHLSVPLL